MPTGNIPGWRRVFADNFTTDVPVGGFSGCTWTTSLTHSNCTGLPRAVRAKLWAYPDTWHDTSGRGEYYPSQVLSIHNGVLDFHLHTANGVHMVAAVLPKIQGTADGTGLKYGAYAVRFKAAALPGYKVAWLLWPDSNIWPSDGEIDFPEGSLDGTIDAFMHHMGATTGSQQNAYATSQRFSKWHTAIIEWTPTYCRFILDGRTIGTSVASIPSDPMHWVLQAETALNGSPPADSTSGNILVDWVVAYTPDS